MNKYENLRSMFQQYRPYSAREITRMEIPTQALVDMTRKGEIKRVTRGVYISAYAPMKPKTDYQIMTLAVPDGVLCLTSALKFHELIKKAPEKMHVALKRHARIPRVDYPPMEFHKFSAETHDLDIQLYPEDDIAIRVYSIEKTIADCFKFRKQIGLDVAVKALKTAVRQRKINYKRLWDITGDCGVRYIVDQHLEALGVV